MPISKLIKSYLYFHFLKLVMHQRSRALLVSRVSIEQIRVITKGPLMYCTTQLIKSNINKENLVQPDLTQSLARISSPSHGGLSMFPSTLFGSKHSPLVNGDDSISQVNHG